MVNQVIYLTSDQSLEKLFEENPSRNLGYGLLKTAGGLASLAAAGGIAFGLLHYGHYINDLLEDDQTFKSVRVFGAGILSAIGLVPTWVELKLGEITRDNLFEGKASLSQKYKLEQGDSSEQDEVSIYHWNGGFTKFTSLDNKHGTLVVPAESRLDLEQNAYKGLHTHVNGFEKEGIENTLSIHADSYVTTLRGSLNDKEVTLKVSANHFFTRKLIYAESGSAFYLEGPLNKRYSIPNIDLKYMDNAHSLTL